MDPAFKVPACRNSGEGNNGRARGHSCACTLTCCPSLLHVQGRRMPDPPAHRCSWQGFPLSITIQLPAQQASTSPNASAAQHFTA